MFQVWTLSELTQPQFPPTVKAQADKPDTEGVARAYYAGVRDRWDEKDVIEDKDRGILF